MGPRRTQRCGQDHASAHRHVRGAEPYRLDESVLSEIDADALAEGLAGVDAEGIDEALIAAIEADEKEN